MIVVEKMAKSLLVYSDMMFTSKHCSSIYFRCKSIVLAFTLYVTVMLLTDLTVHLMTKILVLNVAKKYVKKYRRYPY